jgi:hypothetical protein
VADHAQIPPEIVARLRAMCLDLPAAYEEPAWVGTRWRIGRHTFAHVVMIDAGWPPAYARAASTDGPAIVLTFRAPVGKLDAPGFASHPFFRPPWFTDIAGMFIDDRSDWADIAARLVESYCLLAPKKLIESVDRSTD